MCIPYVCGIWLNKVNPFKQDMIWHIYTTDNIYEHMCICSFLVWKNECLNYREFDLEGDLVGVPHTWYLSAQPFITLIKLVWRQYNIVAMNEWKKKCVGLQRTWVSKRTVCVWNMIEQSKPLQTRYDTTYIRHIYTTYIRQYISDRYFIRTHVYVFLFSVKKQVILPPCIFIPFAII